MAAFIFAETERDTFTVRKAVFRMILTRARARLTDPSDIEEIELSQVIDGISFHSLAEAQRKRLAAAVLAGAKSLKEDIEAAQDSEEPVRAGIEDLLDDLVVFLDSHAGPADADGSGDGLHQRDP